MTSRVVGVALACATALLPVGAAWAQVEHAQRLALEVAIRRAQVRAAWCEQLRAQPSTRMPQAQAAPRLPSSPPSGTAGPVPLGDCSQPLWPMGR